MCQKEFALRNNVKMEMLGNIQEILTMLIIMFMYVEYI